MLAHFGLAFEGREPSGLDDTRNIARIAMTMLQDGTELIANSVNDDGRWCKKIILFLMFFSESTSTAAAGANEECARRLFPVRSLCPTLHPALYVSRAGMVCVPKYPMFPGQSRAHACHCLPTVCVSTFSPSLPLSLTHTHSHIYMLTHMLTIHTHTHTHTTHTHTHSHTYNTHTLTHIQHTHTHTHTHTTHTYTHTNANTHTHIQHTCPKPSVCTSPVPDHSSPCFTSLV
jgi:hypothetical protein